MPRRPFALAVLTLLLVPLGACAAKAAAQPVPVRPTEPGTPRPTEPGPPSPPAPAQSTAVAPSGITRTLRASGEGRVTVKPDVARVTTGVQATGKDLARTTADASARVRRILDELKRLGIEDKDVQTTRHEVQVERPWENGKQGAITGYTVSDDVRVTVRDLTKLPQVLERVVAVGSNVLHGLTFEKDDPSAAQAEALARAVHVARAKAEAMARAAGVTLGEPMFVEEGGGQVPPIPLARRETMMMAAKDAGAPVATGELEILATADVTFAIR